jgi:hypothetical protein
MRRLLPDLLSSRNLSSGGMGMLWISFARMYNCGGDKGMPKRLVVRLGDHGTE